MTTISIRVSEPASLRTTELRLASNSSWLTRCAQWLHSTWCVINGGHYKVLHTEPDRLALRCVACGHTSPGWAVGSARLTRQVPAQPERVRVHNVRRPAVAA
jgi:hypothetical protein